MGEHTPGAWLHRPVPHVIGGWGVWAAGDKVLVGVYTNPRSEADTRLAAAAPDLLTAAVAVLLCFGPESQPQPGTDLDDALDALSAAIAKATGAHRD